MLLSSNIGRSCSLSLLSAGKSTQSVRQAGQGLSLRLDRPGFRPLHFQLRSFSASSSSCRPLNSSLRSALVSFRFQRRPTAFLRVLSTQPPVPRKPDTPQESTEDTELISESPYTIPNALTVARIIACPFLGYQIIHGDYGMATSLLFACGVSDWLDGYLARHYSGKSMLGSILDPAADKTLMTTLVITLAWAGLLPVPLAALILGRDVALSLSAMWFRYTTLPQPRTWGRYLDLSVPFAEIKPTQISKINTALQLVLMGVTTVSPLLSTYPIAAPLEYLQWIVAGTTIWSGLSYVGKAGFKVLPKRKTPSP